MKVSLVTVVLNCSDYIEGCVRSVVDQDYDNIEYIVIDGGSTDGTVSLIKKYHHKIHYFISEKDQGMYDALNKGFAVATGDLVGILNADDLFATKDTISSVVNCFRQTDCDIVYGNLDFISRTDFTKVTRRWKSKPYKPESIKRGWMPAHPTLYMKKEVLVAQGGYSLDFGSCADYELIIRVLQKNSLHLVFLDKLLVLMRNGGMSNGSLRKIYRTMINDYRALSHHKIPNPVLVMLLKKLRKLNQFFIN
nr:glycosyltransferase family 2 protein [Pedobacter panaciterrae]